MYVLFSVMQLPTGNTRELKVQLALIHSFKYVEPGWYKENAVGFKQRRFQRDL